jgi:hypothetical protein
MNKSKTAIFVAALLMTVGTAALCAHMKESRRLGSPGLKIATKPSHDPDGKVVREQSIDLPESVLNYVSKEGPISAEELSTLPQDTLFGRRVYVAPDDFSVTVSVVMMGNDSRSIHKPEICLPAQGWAIEKEKKAISIHSLASYELPVMKVIGSKTITAKDGTVHLVKTVFVYWFVAADDVTADHVSRMLKMGGEMLRTGTLQRWAYVACMSFCYPGQEDATYDRITRFIAASVPEFQMATALPRE